MEPEAYSDKDPRSVSIAVQHCCIEMVCRKPFISETCPLLSCLSCIAADATIPAHASNTTRPVTEEIPRNQSAQLILKSHQQ